MRKCFLFILAVGALSVQAQLSNQSKAGTLGDHEFNNLRYSYAIPLYKQHLKQYPADTAVLYKLGKCYQLNLQYDSAIHYLSIAEALNAVHGASLLPELYAAKGDYDKAVELYKKDLAGVWLNGEQQKRARKRIEGFENRGRFLRDTADYNIGYLSINTGFQEFNAVPYRNGLVFESNRSASINRLNEFGWDGNAFTRLYFAADSSISVTDASHPAFWDEKPSRGSSGRTKESPNDTRIYNVQQVFRRIHVGAVSQFPVFSKTFEKFGNTGAVSMTADGRTAFFTRNVKLNKGVSYLEIWQSHQLPNERWSEPARLNLEQEAPYSVFHPAVTTDGKRLYFASDRPGGYGGTDIYYVERMDDNQWSPVQNAGPAINTAGEELFPTCYGQHLYFSSNGHPGLGGLDIYRIASTLIAQAEPENLGAPINSKADDLGYSRVGQAGYFSSNRRGSDDIFRYTYAEKKVTVSGVVRLPDTVRAKVVLRLYEGKQPVHLVDTVWVGTGGFYQFQVRPNREYTVIVPETRHLAADTFYFVSRNERPYAYTIPTLVAKNTSSVLPAKLVAGMPEVSLQKKKPLVDATEISTLEFIESLHNRRGQMFTVYHPFDKPEYRKVDEAVVQSVIKLMRKRPGMWLQVVSTADCKGSMEYNLGLSERRAKYLYRRLPSDVQKNTRLSWVSKVELREPCPEDKKYNAEDQWRNRYTYLFVTDTPIPDGADMVPGSAKAPKLRVKNAAGSQELLIDFSTKKNIELPKTSSQKTAAFTVPRVIQAGQLVTPGGEIREDKHIAELLKRSVKQPVFIKTRSDSVLVELYDNGVFDHDSVSVFFNKKLLAYKQVLRTTQPIRFYVRLENLPQQNELIMVAENLGLMPPNSALMIITDADRKRNEVFVTSDLQHNSVIYIIKER